MLNFDETFNNSLRDLGATPDPFVLQVGAGDGVHGDFLHPWLQRMHWRALLLEPVEHVYEALCRSYADRKNIQCARIAIGDHTGSSELFRIGDLTGLPWWADQLASFHKHVILSHQASIPDIGNRIVSETVECLTMSMLLTRFSIEHISLLAVDTEGFDANVIRQTLDQGVVPDLILFEHKHLAEDNIRSLYRRLESLEYRLTQGLSDTFCSRTHLSVSVSPF